VLGLSPTGTTARVVLVEGRKADGVTIESEVLDTVAPQGIPKPSPTEQVSNDSPGPRHGLCAATATVSARCRGPSEHTRRSRVRQASNRT
jgi:hypothetical protein